MTAHVLISGQLFREPEQRTSKTGTQFVTATLKIKGGDGFQFWRIAAFQENIYAAGCRRALSVQGAFRAETYEKDGVTKLWLSIVADRVLALRQPGKKADAGKLARQGTPFDDPVPFRRLGMSAPLIRSLPHLERLAWP